MNAARKMIFGLIVFAILFMCPLTSLHAQPSDQQHSPKKAEIVMDSATSPAVRGYIHLAMAWGTQLEPPQQFSNGIVNLAEALRKYSDITPVIDNHVYLSSGEILDMPFLFVTTDRAFELTPTEKANIKRFFDNGGLMFIDNAEPSTNRSQAEASLKKMVKDVLGAHARFAPIPGGHQLYHCHFDFDDGPPQGAEFNPENYYQPQGTYTAYLRPPPLPVFHNHMVSPVHYLEGVTYRGKLAVVYSNKGYIHKWSDLQNNDPQLKFGVNAIVFSLLQMKGLAGR